MATEKDNGPLSDTEGGEKPVREQLKKAKITSIQHAPTSETGSAGTDSENYGHNVEGSADDLEHRGRLSRKRSHEEVDAGSQEVVDGPPRIHTRKRSRDSTLEEELLNNGQRKVSGERARGDDVAEDTQMGPEDVNGTAKPKRPATPELSGERRNEAAVEAMSSPKTKRSRLHSTTAEAATSLPDSEQLSAAKGVTETEEIIEEAATDAKAETGAPVADTSASKIPPTSGFSNSAAVSPFGSLAGNQTSVTGTQSSSSAFASSAFGAASTASTSGFGAVGKHSGGFGAGGSFASGTKSPTENDKPAPSSFGGTLGQKSAFSSAGSAFGTGSSGFGKLGSGGGFGGALGGLGAGVGGTGLSSFASGKSVAPLGGTFKSAKPFGAPPEEAGEEDDEEDDKAGAKSPLATEEEKQDERFYVQEVETGEEGERTAFSARAKLYNFAPGPDGKKEWRERGLGVLRFNVKEADPEVENQKPQARLLIRADGSHRVVLNTPVKKEIKFGAPSGGPPTSGFIYFMGTIEGKEGLEMLQLKMKQANALDLCTQISKLQEEM